MSDSMFLRANRRGLGVYRQPIDIDHTQYEILDPSSTDKWQHCKYDNGVVIFVVSLISYYHYSYGDSETVRGILMPLE